MADGFCTPLHPMSKLLDPSAHPRARNVRRSTAPFSSVPDSGSDRAVFSRPRYHCLEQADALRLTIHVPGTDPAGVDLEVNAPDLTITATHAHSKRSRRLAAVVRDYQLRLRLGFRLAYDAIHAELHGGTLTVMIPKKAPETIRGLGLSGTASQSV